jgi:large subunit ribosomal protein L22
MQVKAQVKHIRMSPSKVRLVVDVVRGLEVGKALDQLKFMSKLAKQPVSKLITSAIANAEHNLELSKDNLYIKEITVDEGKKLYRWLPRAHGRATKLRKRSCHINVVLEEIVASTDKKSKKPTVEAPVKLSDMPKEDKARDGKSIEKEIEKKEMKEKKVAKDESIEKGKKVIDTRSEGKGKHAKIEGQSTKGFIGKVFRRKSG